MKLSTKTVVKWMNVIRHEKGDLGRVMECFWDSQLYSKEWLCDKLPIFDKPVEVVIHGAWYGTLAAMLEDSIQIKSITCVDIDPKCERYVDMFNQSDKVQAVTCDMKEYIYRSTPDIVINTSCEHITDDDYKEWFGNIPTGTLVVVQSNNAFYIEEHINCKNNLMEFVEWSGIQNIHYAGVLEHHKYDRYMVMGWV